MLIAVDKNTIEVVFRVMKLSKKNLKTKYAQINLM